MRCRSTWWPAESVSSHCGGPSAGMSTLVRQVSEEHVVHEAAARLFAQGVPMSHTLSPPRIRSARTRKRGHRAGGAYPGGMPPWIRILGLGLLLLAALWFAWLLKDILLVLAVALLTTAALQPPVKWLDERGFPHLLSVSLCLLILIGLFGGLAAYLIPLVIAQTVQLARHLPALGERISSLGEEWRSMAEGYPFLPRLSDLSSHAADQLTGWIQRSIDLTGRFLLLLGKIFTVFFLTFFFLKDGRPLLEQVVGLLPQRRRDGARALIERVGHRIGIYLLGRLAVMALVGLLTTLGLALFGVPYAALLGVLAGILDIIPYVGPLIAGVPGVLVALSVSWQKAMWTLGIYIVVQVLESNVITPLVLGRSTGLHPVWVLVSILVGAQLLGVIGMVLAIPAAVILQIVLAESRATGTQGRAVTRPHPPPSAGDAGGDHE